MKIVVLLLLAWACSSHKSPPSPSMSETQDKFPEWVFSTEKGCDLELKLCATGQGKTAAQAFDQAKLNLFTTFDVPPKEYGSGFGWEKEVDHEVLNQVNLLTQKISSDMKLEKSYSRDQIFHALAGIDKKTVDQVYRVEIQKSRNALNRLWEVKTRQDVKKLVRLAMKQEALLSRFALVNSELLADEGPSNYEKILDWFKALPAEKISIKVGQAPTWMLDKIEKILTDSGYTIVPNYSDNMLILQVDSIRENHGADVDRFTFTVTLSPSINTQDQVRVIESSLARTQGEALLKVRPALESGIERQFSKLHLEQKAKKI